MKSISTRGWFCIFVLLSTILMIIFQSLSLRSLKNDNDRILNRYHDILEFPDSSALDISEFDGVLDSLSLTTGEKDALKEYVKCISRNTLANTMNQVHLAAISEMKSDDLLIQTRDLLELQFSKIQHEAQSLQIWCGILTIVFLIFSFYSLFKTDELLQRGRDGLKELSEMKIEGDKKIADMIKEGTTKISDFKTNSNNAIRAAAEKAIFKKGEIISELQELVNQSSRDITDNADSALRMLDQKYQDLSEALMLREEKYDSKYNDMLSESRKLVEAQIKTLQMKVNLLEKQK